MVNKMANGKVGLSVAWWGEILAADSVVWLVASTVVRRDATLAERTVKLQAAAMVDRMVGQTVGL